jgi:hypothetical protein
MDERMSDIVSTTANDITTESAVPKPGVDAAEKARVEKILKIAFKEFRTIAAGEDHFRTQALDDTKFRAGTWGKKTYQWPSQIQERREAKNRACITVNRMPGFVRLVTNQARQANLRISVNPVDDNGDPEVAEIFQGIIRNIEQQSFADRAYNMASDKQAEQGRGYFRIITEWAEPNNPKSFKQRIRLRRVKNPLRVYIDLRCEQPDYSDAEFAFYVTDLDIETYKELTGKDDNEVPTPAGLEQLAGNGDATGDWFPNGKIRIAEYFKKERVGARTRIAQLSNGDVIPYPDDATKEKLKAEQLGIVNSRYVQKTQMVWRKIDALNILEESVWKADSQPFIPVLGDELEVDGEVDLRGVVRDAKGSAQIYNVEVTALIEQVGLGTKSPVVGYRGQFGKADADDKLRRSWENANTEPVPFLEVEPFDIDGKPAPLPQPINYEVPIQGTIMAIKQADEDLKTTAGFRDASLAERGPQESGKAIKLRQDQDFLQSSHYLDNLRFALCSAGRQLIQLIRVIYDAPTIVRITGKDDRPKKVMVFSGENKDPRNPEYLETHQGTDPLTMNDGKVVQPGEKIPFQLPDGVDGIYRIDVGEFDTEVSATPDHGTRRQEDLATITEVMKGLPPEMALKFLDLYFMLIDSPVGRQMHERAKRLFPPPEDQKDGEPNPQQMQAEMEKMKAEFEQVTQMLQETQLELKTEKNKIAAQVVMNREKIASAEKIANEKTRGAIAVEALDHAGDKDLTRIEAKFDFLMAHLDRLHERAAAAQSNVDAATGRVADVEDADRARAADAEEAQAQAAAEPAAPADGAPAA